MAEPVRATFKGLKADRQADTLLNLESADGLLQLALSNGDTEKMLGAVMESLGSLWLEANITRVRSFNDGSNRYSLEFRVHDVTDEPEVWVNMVCSAETARGLHVGLYNAVGGTTRLLAPAASR